MRWPVLAAEYPNSILREELPLTILALLESRGLTQEETLAELLGESLARTNRVLLQLHENRFVEYGKGFVKVSENGRWLLDRLGLSETLVDDFLRFAGAEHLNIATDFLPLVQRYRELAFFHYLNSVCTVRVWLDTAAAAVGKPESTERMELAVAFLLRDLKSWVRHTDPSAEFVKAISSRLYVLLRPESVLDAGLDVHDQRNSLAQADVLLRIGRHAIAIEAKDYRRFAFTESNSDYLLLSRLLNRFQQHHPIDAWFSEWKQERNRIVHKGVESRDEWRHALERLNADAISEWKAGTSGYWESFPEQPKIADLKILGLLDGDVSVSDLAELMGCSHEYAKKTVWVLLQQCQRVLTRRTELLEPSPELKPKV